MRALTRLSKPIGALALGALACGGAQSPRLADIYHDPALRPSVDEADDVDRAFLAQVVARPESGTLRIQDRVYVVRAIHHAASGRRCRPVVESDRSRLICEVSARRWAFVPNVMAEAP